ncbi:hypothetical protein QFC20_003980 [Naganishia adeliensis]|uniref:Uncharacterized protein n=1 Tax=Naganishia adeliensis TaxID=92952 RepID=A0ACC2W7G2_9TREE|nr:hypothetical protein QFC20_003980 [Naganishia adeliensis]
MSGPQVTQVQPYHDQQGSPMAYLTFPHNMVSPNTSYAPLAPTAPPNHSQVMHYHYHPSATNMNWPNSMSSRILPSPPVKLEPLEPEGHAFFDSQTTHSPRDNHRYVSQTFRYNSAPMYQGRLHLRGPPNQMFANQQGRGYGNDFGTNSYMTASEVDHYNWQQQQQQYAHQYHSSRSSFSSSMLEATISTDSNATLAPVDAMKPSSPASSASCGNEPAPMADVSITLHPSTYPQIQSGNLQASAAYVSPMDVQSTRHMTPIAMKTPISTKDDEDDNDKHSGQGVMATSIHSYRVPSLLEMPAATSNLRNEPANNGVTDPSRIPPRVPAFASDIPRAAAQIASKRITALAKPGGAEHEEETYKPKTNAKPSPKRKRTAKPKSKANASAVKKRAITVTSAAVCRIPNPIPNYRINKKSRGRTVTTDPNEIDSNIVHVCPVPSCGACFKRREHVKRHIRGLHTEDKVFDLYANLATRGQENNSLKAGLGHVSANEAIYHVDFELHPISRTSATASGAGHSEHSAKHASRRSKPKKSLVRRGEMAEKMVSVEIAQDLASLRNRKGDTGSVIWRASLFLAKQILQLHHFPVPSSTPFLRTEQASTAKVLELGAGTGVLGVLLHQLFRSWTASDQYDHLKLIARNVKQNGDPENVHVEEVDWMDIHAKWIKGKQGRNEALWGFSNANGVGEDYDLVVAVDCIYNEALIPPFLSTLEYYTTKGKTIALIACELRSADVMTAFLEEWIGRGGWTIYRLSDMALGDELKYNFVAWVAWKTVE